MRIISQPKKPTWNQVIECSGCHSVLEAEFGDLRKYKEEPWGPSGLVVVCPVCGKSFEINLSLEDNEGLFSAVTARL